MAARDHQTRVAKLRAIVTTVDPSQSLVEVATFDGSARRLYITDIDPAGFVWPQVDEEWSIYEENGYWRLGNKFLNQDELAELNSLAPGEQWPPVINTGDKNYLHTQSVPSSVWVVTHDLNKYPSVTVTTSSGLRVEMEEKHDSLNQVTLTSHIGDFSGKAFFN